MKTKQEILAEVQEALSSGVLTEADIVPFVTISREVVIVKAAAPEDKSEKLSAVDIMFYIAGIVLFSTIMSIIVQTWHDGDIFVHVLLSTVVGAGLWSLAYYLIKSPFQNDIRRGLTNALLLTGSFLLVVGGYIVTNHIVDGFSEINYISTALTLAILGGIHIAFDKFIKRDLILLMGVLLAVFSFPMLLFGLLRDSDLPMLTDIWAVIFILTSVLLAYATRVVAKSNPDRKKIRTAFDSFSAFLALMSMYVASYGDLDVMWLVVLIAAVLGIFYLSIILQNKHLLGNGSFFMVLTIITISFRYFSGYGTTFSLIVATIGLLGSAAVASSINKKYFK